MAQYKKRTSATVRQTKKCGEIVHFSIFIVVYSADAPSLATCQDWNGQGSNATKR